MSSAPYLRPGQAADYIGISQSTLAKMRVSGIGPVFSKLGRTVIYRRSDLDAWVQENIRRSTSDIAA